MTKLDEAKEALECWTQPDGNDSFAHTCVRKLLAHCEEQEAEVAMLRALVEVLGESHAGERAARLVEDGHYAAGCLRDIWTEAKRRAAKNLSDECPRCGARIESADLGDHVCYRCGWAEARLRSEKGEGDGA